MKNNLQIKVLALSVTGTSVQWLEPVKDSLDLAVSPGGIFLDWTDFTISWRLRSLEILAEINQGNRSWTTMNEVNLLTLKELIPGTPLDEWDDLRARNLNQAWQQLRPWPDTVPALNQFKKRFRIYAVSNSDYSMLTTITKNLQLPWDHLISAESVQKYKPEKLFYEFVVSEVGVDPSQILMVSSDLSDLRGASSVGIKTAYIKRSDESDNPIAGNPSDVEHDFEAEDLIQLADQLNKL